MVSLINVFYSVFKSLLMFIPVRIRGKKRSKRVLKKMVMVGPSEADDSLAVPVPSSSKNSSPTKPGRAVPVLAPLEKLPVELLQIIFFYSLNLSLPQASPHIGAALASRHVRTQLVLVAFGPLKEYRGGELQSKLLRQKWLTYAFFQHCQKTYMLHQAILAYRSTMLISSPPDSFQNLELARMSKWFDDYYDVSSRLYNKLKLWISKRETIPSEHIFEWTDGKGESHHINFSFGGQRMTIRHLLMDQATTHLFPHLRRHCVIPEKLLHGPWTHEKGHMLALLLCSCASISWIDSTGGEIAMQGLADAIREDNLTAVKALVGNRKGYPPLPEQFERCFGTNAGEYDDNELKAMVAPQSKWLFHDMEVPHVGAEVKISTQHLKIAVLEMEANREMVLALMGGTRLAIDCDDPEILEWACSRAEDGGEDHSDDSDPSIISGRELLSALSAERLKQMWSTLCH